MCFHSETDLHEYLSQTAGRSKIKGYIAQTTVGGRFLDGYTIDVRNEQDIANMIRNLRKWHPTANGRNTKIYMNDVNERRAKLGLPELDEKGLPIPVGVAPESAEAMDPVFAEYSKIDDMDSGPLKADAKRKFFAKYKDVYREEEVPEAVHA